MAKEKTTAEKKRLDVEVVKQMITLSTSGFGVVAALAWNSLIQELVSNYIKKWFPKDSGLITLFLYALLVTALAVMVTLQLSKLLDRLENK